MSRGGLARAKHIAASLMWLQSIPMINALSQSFCAALLVTGNRWCGLAQNMIAPHRQPRRRPATQDGRKLRRYRRRWKIERLNAWLQNYRRVLVRYEHIAENYLAFVQLACI